MKSFSTPRHVFRGKLDKNISQRVFFEVVILLVLTFSAQFLREDLRTIFTFAPLAYFFVERYLRRRRWADAGFKLRAVPQDVIANWFLILMVSVIIQFLVVWAARNWLPAFIDHVISRLPIGISQTANYLPFFIVGTLVGTMLEEITFRAFFQDRLSWFIPELIAIGLVSIVFGVGHWASGNPVIVLMDVLLVIVDSLFYGIIFARTRNVFVSWIAHFLANLFALSFVLVL